jgi:hypothetical protein
VSILTARDLGTAALYEINQFSPGESIPAADLEFAREKANQILDAWAAREIYAYSTSFKQFNLTPNHAVHTIGPVAADVAWNIRPVKIASAKNVLSSTIESPITIRDNDWWNANNAKGITSSLPTDLYYAPDFPNGSLNFWPICSVAQAVIIEMWALIDQFATLDDPVNLPPAYKTALTLTLAEMLSGPYGATVSTTTELLAREARVALQGNNMQSPRISAQQSGLPRSRKGYWNYTTGERI